MLGAQKLDTHRGIDESGILLGLDLKRQDGLQTARREARRKQRDHAFGSPTGERVEIEKQLSWCGLQESFRLWTEDFNRYYR